MIEPVNQKDLKFTFSPGNARVGLLFWSAGWLFFAVGEALAATITGPKLPLSIAFLTIICYLFLGLAGSAVLLGMLTIFSQGINKLQQLKSGPFYAASCIAMIILLFISFTLKRTVFETTGIVLSLTIQTALCIFSAALFFLLYRLFTAAHNSNRLLTSFFSFCISLDAFLVSGLVFNSKLSNGSFSHLMFQCITINGVLAVGCIVIFFSVFYFLEFLLARLSRTAQWHKALISITVLLFFVLSFLIIAKRTDRTHFLAEIVALIKKRPSVVLISMDTTRADHLSCYGYERKTTSNLDRLAKQGIIFEKAYSPASWTLPAHASLMTATYPFVHAAHRSDKAKPPFYSHILGNDNVTLAEILSRYGYKTAGIIGGVLCSSAFGLNQGFAYFDDDLPPSGSRTAREINCAVGACLNRELKKRFTLFNFKLPLFLFVHYFDPHHPYMPPEPFSSLFAGRNDDVVNNYNQPGKMHYRQNEWLLFTDVIKGNHKLSTREKAHLLSQYDGEIAYMDYHIGMLLQRLKALGLYDNTMLIVTADHGEMFGEHNLMIHGIALYEELLRVPLIIKYPSSQKKTGTIDAMVSLIDIMPEILTTINLPVPDNIQGRPVNNREDIIIAENYQDPTWKNRMGYERIASDLKAIYSGDFKFIWSSDGNHKLFNLAADPAELHNLASILPEKARQLKEKLFYQYKKTKPVAGAAPASLSPHSAVRQQLRALGYMQ